MKVLIVNLGYPPNVVGGAEVAVHALATELARAGDGVTVASLSERPTDWRYEKDGVSARFLAAHPMGNLLLDRDRTSFQRIAWHVIGEINPSAERKIASVIVSEKPDVVHTANLIGLSTGVWRAAHKLGRPIVHTLQDYQLICPRGTMFRGGQPCRKQCPGCFSFTLRRRRDSALASEVVGISEFVLKAHTSRGYFPSARPSVIPNGFVATQVRTPQEGRVGDRLRIGFIGRFHPTKGLELLIEALGRLPADRFTAKIAGGGSPRYESELRDRAEGLPVEFLGWMPQDEFYREIDILVVPSLYHEPQGLVLLEALARAIPVVYADRGGLGEAGASRPGAVPFDPDDPKHLSAALARFIAHPGNIAALKAKMASAKLSPTVPETAATYRAIYARLCASSRRAA